MALTSSDMFGLTYAGIPFALDTARVFRADVDGNEGSNDRVAFEKTQPESDLLDEINRLLPSLYLNDFGPRPSFPGKNIYGLGYPTQTNIPSPEIRIGDWYYPPTASRWSVFRGLATSSQVRAMLAATQNVPAGSPVIENTSQPIPVSPTGSRPQKFIMRAVAQGTGVGQADIDEDDEEAIASGINVNAYTLESMMYMLPPRPLGETAGEFDGLYLVTLVDERYWWQWLPVSLFVGVRQMPANTTWPGIITQLAAQLGIFITIDAILPVYGVPEPDSPLWINMENAAVYLDAVANNIGRRVVRKLDGTYVLLSGNQSRVVTGFNAGELGGDFRQRIAGGDMFNPITTLPIGNIQQASVNLTVPASVNVTFPLYIAGDDPVPHYSNARFLAPRGTTWTEDSYGDVYIFNVPISKALPNQTGTTGRGYVLYDVGPLATSTFVHVIHDTAKAMAVSETLNLTLINYTELENLAIQMAGDYYSYQVGSALDEVFPGTFAWQPEGFHDIIWSYSARMKGPRGACTRIMRTQWNQMMQEMQHGTPGVPSVHVKGIGGKAVAQSIRDSQPDPQLLVQPGSAIATTLTASMGDGGIPGYAPGAGTAQFNSVDYFPTQNRWKGQVGDEIVLFEGTSGGFGGPGAWIVSMVYRGIDGTLPTAHPPGTVVRQVLPNTTFGVNLTTAEQGQYVYPSQWTPWGIQAVNVVPQTQTIQVFDASGTIIDGVRHYSGALLQYSMGRTTYPWSPTETVWVIDRNNLMKSGSPLLWETSPIQSGHLYDGQFVGYNKTVQSRLSQTPFEAYDVQKFAQATRVYAVNDDHFAGFPTYTSGMLSTIPCNYPKFIKQQGPGANGGSPPPKYTSLTTDEVRPTFGLNFQGSSGADRSQYMLVAGTATTCPYYVSPCPGITWKTYYSDGYNDTGNYTTVNVLPEIAFPVPPTLLFYNTCNILWTVVNNPSQNLTQVAAFWPGFTVRGGSATASCSGCVGTETTTISTSGGMFIGVRDGLASGGTTSGGVIINSGTIVNSGIAVNVRANIDTLEFNPCNFSLEDVPGTCGTSIGTTIYTSGSTPPNPSDSWVGLKGVKIKTNGATGKPLAVRDVIFCPDTCEILVLHRYFCFQDGLYVGVNNLEDEEDECPPP